jgi:hypothetical protein
MLMQPLPGRTRVSEEILAAEGDAFMAVMAAVG